MMVFPFLLILVFFPLEEAMALPLTVVLETYGRRGVVAALLVAVVFLSFPVVFLLLLVTIVQGALGMRTGLTEKMLQGKGLLE